MKRRGGLIAGALILALGIAGLLNELDVVPGVNWIWTLGLAVVGLLVILFGGYNKASMVVGPFVLIGAVLSFLRQTGNLSQTIEVPILTVVLGLLLLVVYLLRVPDPVVEPSTKDPE
jgi:hypothetical protein